MIRSNEITYQFLNSGPFDSVYVPRTVETATDILIKADDSIFDKLDVTFHPVARVDPLGSSYGGIVAFNYIDLIEYVKSALNKGRKEVSISFSPEMEIMVANNHGSAIKFLHSRYISEFRENGIKISPNTGIFTKYSIPKKKNVLDKRILVKLKTSTSDYILRQINKKYDICIQSGSGSDKILQFGKQILGLKLEDILSDSDFAWNDRYYNSHIKTRYISFDILLDTLLQSAKKEHIRELEISAYKEWFNCPIDEK